MVSAADLKSLLLGWLGDQQSCYGYDPEDHAGNPLAQFFVDMGYVEAVWVERARVVVLTPCARYLTPATVYDAVAAQPHTFGALLMRMKELESHEKPSRDDHHREQRLLETRACSVPR